MISCNGAGKTTAAYALLPNLLNCREFVTTLPIAPNRLLTVPMKTLTLHLPDSLDLDAKEITMLLATRLYEQGKLSLGQAAEMAGYSKRTFMELLGDYGVSVFNLTEEELLNDVQNAARYHR